MGNPSRGPKPTVGLVPLTKGYLAHVDIEDYSRVMNFKWYAAVQLRKDGSIKNVYAQRHTRGKTILLHRFILGLPAKRLPQVDHEDHNGLNCRRDNLRKATNAQNLYGRRKSPSKSTSQYKGVSWDKDRNLWTAQIQIKGKTIRLGRFSVEKEAALAYITAAKRYFRKFAYFQGEQWIHY